MVWSAEYMYMMHFQAQFSLMHLMTCLKALFNILGKTFIHFLAES